MIKNYLKVLVRNMQKQWSFAVINLVGLSTGIACFILIALFVRDELTFDKFHSNGPRIHRLLAKLDNPDIVIMPPNALAPLLVEEYPEVEAVVRIRYERKAVQYEGELIYEDEFYMVDPNLFEVFDFPLAQGNPETALDAPYKLVLSQEMANKYFPNQEALGQTMRFANDTEDYHITGILDKVPENSRFQFDFITSFETPFATNNWEVSK